MEETENATSAEAGTTAILKEKLYTIKEVAEMIGVARKTVYLWKDEGRINVVYIAGSVIRVPASELAAFLNRQELKRTRRRPPVKKDAAPADTESPTEPPTDQPASLEQPAPWESKDEDKMRDFLTGKDEPEPAQGSEPEATDEQEQTEGQAYNENITGEVEQLRRIYSANE